MHNDCTRRQWLAGAGGAAMTRPFAPAASAAASSMGPTPRVAIAKCPTYGAELLPAMQRMFDQLGGLERLVKGKTVAASSMGPTPRVAIAKCPTYGAELLPAMQRMFDQLGGLERLVKGKTVAIKINMTGDTSYRLGHTPAEDTHYTHPRVIAATVLLMGRAGARRVRLLESCWSSSGPLEEFMLQVNWEPRDLASAAPRVEFENTNYLGRARKYVRMATPKGGHMFGAFDLTHPSQDCDVSCRWRK